MNEQYNQPSKPPVLMIAGKTCAGKTAVMKELCNNFGYHKCITATSREPRPGEVDGVDYFFLSRAAFERQLRNMEFAEHVERNGVLYGTPMFEIFSDKSSKSAIILDPDGIKSCEARLKELQIPVIKVLVDAPDEVCIQRLLNREADSGEIQKRMAELRNPAAWRNSNKGLEYTMVLNSERRTPLEIAHYIFKATEEMYTPALPKPPVTDQEAECLIAAARQYQISFSQKP